jgi:2-dehydropantoate 2-reductase
VLIARGAHCEAMRRDGVRIVGARGDFTTPVEATDDFDAIRDADVAFLGLKAYGLVDHAEAIGSRLRPGASVVAAQNGIPWWYFQSHPGPLGGIALDSVDPGGRIAAAIAPERVVGCVLYCSTEVVAPGVIRHVEGRRFLIGEPAGGISERCDAIAGAFAAGGLKCPVARNLREHVWLKLIGNVAFNPMSAIGGATMAELGRVPEVRALLRAVMEEAAAVAEALGVELPLPIDRRLERAFEVGDHRPSMLQDRDAGKPLELDCLTGALIELAARLELPVPHTRAIHACATLVDPGLRDRLV